MGLKLDFYFDLLKKYFMADENEIIYYERSE